MKYALTVSSKNKKIGPIPVVTVSKDTCPPSCPLVTNGCYAEHGPMAIHWNRVSRGEHGLDFDEFLKQLRRLPKGTIWRYGQAGDLPGSGGKINAAQLNQLAHASQNRPALAYTHNPPTPENLQALQNAEKIGFHVNLSANSPKHADILLKTGQSVVTILESQYQRGPKEPLGDYKNRVNALGLHTPEGTRIAICPATYAETDCLHCMACSTRRPQDTVIGFPAHGSRKKTVDKQVLDYERRQENNPSG